MIGFGFASDWLRKGCEFRGPITEGSKAQLTQSWITFDTQLKFAQQENLFGIQELLKWMIISFILLIFTFDPRVVLWGESQGGQRVNDGEDCTYFANDQLEKFVLNFYSYPTLVYLFDSIYLSFGINSYNYFIIAYVLFNSIYISFGINSYNYFIIAYVLSFIIRDIYFHFQFLRTCLTM